MALCPPSPCGPTFHLRRYNAGVWEEVNNSAHFTDCDNVMAIDDGYALAPLALGVDLADHPVLIWRAYAAPQACVLF